MTNSTERAPNNNPKVLCNMPIAESGSRLTSFEESHKDRAVRAMTTATGLKPITCS